jgi:predicted choloylglycine hydrolase
VQTVNLRVLFFSMLQVFIVVCTGYDLSLTNRYVDKLLENVDELLYKSKRSTVHPEMSTSQIVGIRSKLGERLPLSKV